MLGNILLAVWEFLKGKWAWVIILLMLLIIPFGYFAQYVKPNTNIEVNVRKGSSEYKMLMELKNTFSDQAIPIMVRGKSMSDLMSEQNMAAMRYVKEQADNNPKFADRILFSMSPAFFLDYLAKMGMYNPETTTPEDFIIEKDGSLNPTVSSLFLVAPEEKFDDPVWQKYTYIDENGQRKPYYHALIPIGLRGSWDNDDMTDLLDDVRAWVHDAGFDENVTTIVTGLPIIMNWMANELPKTLFTLMFIGSIIMMLLLTFGFRVLGRKPRRWLVVLIVLTSIVYTLGICGMIDVPLTNASTVVFPILLGMGVDTSVQVHNRYDEEIRKGKTADEAAKTTIRRVVRPLWYGMTLVLIGFATVFLVNNQQITYFGIALIIGVAICMVVMLMFITGILYTLDKRGDATRKPMPRPAGWLEKSMGWSVPRMARFGILLIVIGVIAAGVGWWIDEDQLGVGGGFDASIAQDVQELKDMKYLQILSGGISPTNVIVKVKEGRSVMEPEVLEWVHERTMLAMDMGSKEKGGYLGAYNNLGSLFAEQFGGIPEDAQTAESMLTTYLPREMWISMVNDDRTALSVNFSNWSDLSTAATSTQNILEGLFYGPDSMQPEAVASSRVTGLNILGPIMDKAMTQSRNMLTSVGVGGMVFVMLFMFKLNWRRVIAAAFPILMVLGWSSLAMWALGQKITMMTALLPAQMMAIGIELTILLLMRYYEERDKGEHPIMAMTTAMSRIGRAIMISGGVMFVGFFVMIFAFKFPFIQDFGYITMVDMALIIIAVLVVMPALVLTFDLRFRKDKFVPAPPVEEIMAEK